VSVSIIPEQKTDERHSRWRQSPARMIGTLTLCQCYRNVSDKPSLELLRTRRVSRKFPPGLGLRTIRRKMGQNFKPYDQSQLFLMPPAVSEWVAQESLSRFLSEAVDRLDRDGRLGDFYAAYREDGWGRAAYSPVMMVKVLLYGYCKGITSSRRLAEALEMDVAFRYLAANQQPNFRTISDFRKDHLRNLERLFPVVLELCREAGMVKLGRVALDGTRLASNASLEANRTKAQLEAEVRRMLQQSIETDAEEDARYGGDQRGDELPEGLRTPGDRAARIQEAIERLKAEEEAERAAQAEKVRKQEEEEQRRGKRKQGRRPKAPESVEPKERRANPTDPQSFTMKSKRGWVQGYNAQAAADCESQVIVATDIADSGVDQRQLLPMLSRIAEQAGAMPEQLLADAGYWSAQNEAEGSKHTDLLIATRNARRQEPAPRFQSKGPRARKATAREAMEAKLQTEDGKAAYAQRSTTIEPVFGQMRTRGLRTLLLRGRDKARGEWSLWCTTHNLLKLWRAALRRTASGSARFAFAS
jgi:transposase